MANKDELDILRDPVVERPRKRDRLVNAAGKAKDQAVALMTDPRVVAGAQRAFSAVEGTLTNPANVEKVQGAFAWIGSRAMERTFDADPVARSLFEYAEWCEDTRSRAEVSQSVFRHGLKLPFDILGLVEATVRRGTMDPADFERMQNLTLDLMWSMATDAARPQTTSGLLNGLEREGIPEEFQSLFMRARGLSESVSGEEKGGLLEKWVPDMDSDAARFIIRSLPVFLQSYLLRLAVESMPDLLAREP